MLAWFVQRIVEFSQNIVTHDLVIQLFFALRVKSKSSDFALNLALFGLIATVFGSAADELNQLVTVFTFVREIPQIIAQDGLWLVRIIGVFNINHRIRVKVENAMT